MQLIYKIILGLVIWCLVMFVITLFCGSILGLCFAVKDLVSKSKPATEK